MVAYCNVHLRVIGGHELPKTDMFSQIDPYVVVSFMGETLGRTVTRDNNPNPVWEEDFFFEAEEDDDGLHGTITLDLYDEEVAKDEYVGSIRLDLESLSPEMLLQPIELPVAYKNDKRGQKLARGAPRARLALQLVATGKGFSSYALELDEAEGIILDERSETVLVPVPDTEESLWAGLRFTRRSRQLLLLSTADPRAAPNPAVWYDLAYSGSSSLRMERLQYRKPVKMLGLKVWSELRATNVPLDAKLSKVRILERERRLVDTIDPADVLVGHGYMIGMPFLAAVKELSKRPTVHADAAAQSIWIRMDPNQPQPAQLLQLDYSDQRLARDTTEAVALVDGTSPGSKKGTSGGGGGRKEDEGNFPALRICSTSSELNKGYELAFFGDGGRAAAGPIVTVSEAFRRPKPVLGGLYDIVHTVELRDAFVGEALEETGLGCYELMKASRTWRLGKLLNAATRGELGDIDESGYGNGDGRGGIEGDGNDGPGGIGSAGDLVRSLLSCIPCMAPQRVDAYLVEGQAKGGDKKSWRSLKHKEREDGRDKGHRHDSRGGGDGDDHRGGSVSRIQSSSITGTESVRNSFARAPPSTRSGAAAGRLANTSSGGGGGGASGGTLTNRGSVGAAASVGSSSGRSAGLAMYNSTKMKYTSRK
ncbi:hypothetical protein VaNZ11_012601 [Volvox africanus]|uniref:C2 domain-containing protein n=1 Tax=Volvox africanus TaxID=51714 RepID=A0ABQ5SEA4_9CHLO|nr:hypothetical protein VaNZ11_012601 [Volvox africanus]